MDFSNWRLLQIRFCMYLISLSIIVAVSKLEADPVRRSSVLKSLSGL
jgi:hypothetical protein